MQDQAFYLHGHASLITRTRRGHKETPQRLGGAEDAGVEERRHGLPRGVHPPATAIRRGEGI
uniref:Anaphase promoting complex subunit, putative n=1 Tax=Arundo donax TaxID=35708 RepID=A0A0A9CW40_ARUDO